MAAVFVPYLVVSTHYAPGFTIDYGTPESREIYFIKGTVGNLDVKVTTPFLLIIKGKMFYTCGNTVFLKALNVRHNHFSDKVRILAHILEVPAIEESAVDVYTGSEEHIFLR